jgi:hypothetical protein
VKTERSAYTANLQMMVGAALLNEQTSAATAAARARDVERQHWAAVLVARDARRNARRAVKPAPSVFARLLSLFV